MNKNRPDSIFDAIEQARKEGRGSIRLDYEITKQARAHLELEGYEVIQYPWDDNFPAETIVKF